MCARTIFQNNVSSHNTKQENISISKRLILYTRSLLYLRQKKLREKGCKKKMRHEKKIKSNQRGKKDNLKQRSRNRGFSFVEMEKMSL